MLSSDDLMVHKDNAMIAISSQNFIYNRYAAIILRARYGILDVSCRGVLPS